MRISDWSSDVCSSDLLNGIRLATHLAFLRVVLGNLTGQVIPRHRAIHLVQELLTACLLALTGKFRFRKTQLAHDEQTREGVTDEVYRWAGERSEERRVGKECVRTCRSR